MRAPALLAVGASLGLIGCATARDDSAPVGADGGTGGGGQADAGVDAAVCIPASCDDQDPCTDDTCEAQGCVHTPVDPTGSMTFAYTGSLQMFEVPQCETSIRIVAEGAQGGGSNGQPGGMGASMAGTFMVTPGQTLEILAGGQGVAGSTATAAQRGGTGGGGTFVVSGTTMLVIAGGGGGAIGGFGFGQGPGGPGQTTMNGQPGAGGALGGSNGNGGTTWANTAYHGGTGGGGYQGNGVNNSNGGSNFGTPNVPGKAYVNGGAGGTAGSAGRNGGYGGGGSGGYTGAGGGGYSGGGAGNGPGSGSTTYNGGGGGSINNGDDQTNTAGACAGNGQVEITW